jgi:hypothetical protein
MYLFKTSGATYSSVIKNQKHAYIGMPKDWYPGELVLVSKNKVDCEPYEKQIQCIMKLDNIRTLQPGESELFWPGNGKNWQYLFECKEIVKLTQPFDLNQAIGQVEYKNNYRRVMTYKRLSSAHESLVIMFLRKSGVNM